MAHQNTKRLPRQALKELTNNRKVAPVGSMTTLSLVKRLPIEFFARRRSVFVSVQVVSWCRFDKPPKNYAAHALQHYTHV